jgi:hypothetical protein
MVVNTVKPEITAKLVTVVNMASLSKCAINVENQRRKTKKNISLFLTKSDFLYIILAKRLDGWNFY